MTFNVRSDDNNHIRFDAERMNVVPIVFQFRAYFVRSNFLFRFSRNTRSGTWRPWDCPRTDTIPIVAYFGGIEKFDWNYKSTKVDYVFQNMLGQNVCEFYWFCICWKIIVSQLNGLSYSVILLQLSRFLAAVSWLLLAWSLLQPSSMCCLHVVLGVLRVFNPGPSILLFCDRSLSLLQRSSKNAGNTKKALTKSSKKDISVTASKTSN